MKVRLKCHMAGYKVGSEFRFELAIKLADEVSENIFVVAEHFAHFLPLAILFQLDKAFPAQFRCEYLRSQDPHVDQFRYFGQGLLIRLALKNEFKRNHLLNLLRHRPPKLLNGIHHQC